MGHPYNLRHSTEVASDLCSPPQVRGEGPERDGRRLPGLPRALPPRLLHRPRRPLVPPPGGRGPAAHELEFGQ